jgi:hypothetical protein
MKSIVVPAVLAIAFAAAGSIFWTMGKTETRLADAHKELAVLQYSEAAAESDQTIADAPMVQRLAGLGRDDQVDARHVRTAADYWQAQYAALQPKRDTAGTITETDPDVLLHAANASFRASQGESDRNLALRRLDSVVKSYAEVLKGNGASTDAAFNYEYAIRVRDALTKAKPAQVARAAADKKADAGEGDLPPGPTIHGRPGGPPAKTDMAQFKIVIPKRGEERKDDPQAGKGNVKIRKG